MPVLMTDMENEPVRAWLIKLPKEDRQQIGEGIAYVQKMAHRQAASRSSERPCLENTRDAEDADCTCVICSRRRPHVVAARIYQEESKYATRGYGLGADTV
jgi:hypothetical protein